MSQVQALCQLPHSKLPFPVIVHNVPFLQFKTDEVQSDHKQNPVTVMISLRGDLNRLENWLGDQKGEFRCTENLRVPWKCLIFNVLTKSKQLSQKVEIKCGDPHSEEPFVFDGDLYESRNLTNVSVGGYYIYNAKHHLLFGKIVFIGIKCRDEDDYEHIHIFFESTTDPNYAETKHAVGSFVHKVKLEELYSLSEFQRLEKETRKLCIIPESNETTNILELTEKSIELVDDHCLQETTAIYSAVTSVNDVSNNEFVFVDNQGHEAGQVNSEIEELDVKLEANRDNNLRQLAPEYHVTNVLEMKIISREHLSRIEEKLDIKENPNNDQTNNIQTDDPRNSNEKYEPLNRAQDISNSGHSDDDLHSSINSEIDSLNSRASDQPIKSDKSTCQKDMLNQSQEFENSGEGEDHVVLPSVNTETGADTSNIQESKEVGEVISESRAVSSDSSLLKETNIDDISEEDETEDTETPMNREISASNSEKNEKEERKNPPCRRTLPDTDKTEITQENQITPPVAAQRKKQNVGESSLSTQRSSFDEQMYTSDSTNVIQVIGNCLALKNGTKQKEIEGIRSGLTFVVRTTGDVILGEVKMTCIIKGLTRNAYVGVKLKNSLHTDQTGDRTLAIQHVDEWDGTYCEKCNGAKLLFIPLSTIGETEDYIFGVIPSDENVATENEFTNDTVDINHEMSRKEEFIKEPMSIDTLKKGTLRKLGIEGRNNSCYADSMFMVMFAFHSVFDNVIFMNRESLPITEDKSNSNINAAIVNILKLDIINPLRRTEKVPWKSMQKLRTLFAHYDAASNGRYMDIEEFALIFFRKILDTPSFFQYDAEYGDYIYQIFVAAEDVPDIPLPHLEYLLQESFKQQEVTLLSVPQPAFIIKLPVCEGNPTFSRVYVDTDIPINIVCKNAKESDRMTLSAVICLKDSHFTCFIRLKDVLTSDSSEENEYVWIYHDSMPTQKHSRVVVIPNFEMCYRYKGSVEEAKNNNEKNGSSGITEKFNETNDWINHLLTTAYMCVYVPLQ